MLLKLTSFLQNAYLFRNQSQQEMSFYTSNSPNQSISLTCLIDTLLSRNNYDESKAIFLSNFACVLIVRSSFFCYENISSSRHAIHEAYFKK